MKKNTLKRAFSALAVSAMAVSATSLSASALYSVNNQDNQEVKYVDEYDYPHGQLDASQATVKPHVWIDKIELSLDEAKANPKQAVNVNVENADGKVTTIGIHVIYDTRLNLEVYRGTNYVKIGEALEGFGKEEKLVEPGLITITSMNADENNFGSGAAVTTVWMLMMIAVVFVYNRIFRKEDM